MVLITRLQKCVCPKPQKKPELHELQNMEMWVPVLCQIRAERININVVMGQGNPCTSVIMHTVRFNNIMQFYKIRHWKLLVLNKRTASWWQYSVIKGKFISNFKFHGFEELRFQNIWFTNYKIWNILLIRKGELRKTREGSVCTWLDIWPK